MRCHGGAKPNSASSFADGLLESGDAISDTRSRQPHFDMRTPVVMHPLRHRFGDNRGMKMRAADRIAVVCLALFCGWTSVADALESRRAHLNEVDYRVVDLDLSRDKLDVHWHGADLQPFASIEGVRQWGAAQGRQLLFATNAGIYDRQFQPLGLYIEDGATLRPLNTSRGAPRAGNFAIQPNGVFYVDAKGRAGIVTTAHWREHAVDARLATQSGPMLVIDGAINPNFDAESDSLKWRSGVCAKTAQRVIFVVSEAPVTFHAFARLFQREIGCRDALYLDGTLSRIYTKADGYSGAPAIMVKPYAAMLAVFASDTASE